MQRFSYLGRRRFGMTIRRGQREGRRVVEPLEKEGRESGRRRELDRYWMLGARKSGVESLKFVFGELSSGKA